MKKRQASAPNGTASKRNAKPHSKDRLPAQESAPVYDPEGQARRRREAYDFILPYVRPLFTLEGDRLVDRFPYPSDKRLRLWIAGALLAGKADDQALGDAILRGIHFNHACHFTMAWTFAILGRHDRRLRPETVKHLEEYVLRYLLDLMTADYHFHGANDNAPAECATALVLAGERFGEKSYLDFGRERLGDLDAVLSRRGTIFECNSPTYSAATLTAVTELAEYARDPEVRRIALRAEQRIWQEIALSFHPETRHQMGPYSRAYEDDLVQHSTDMTYAIYQALGPIQPTNPLALLGAHVPGTINHNCFNFGRASALRSVTPDYHIAPETADLFLNKPLPFRVYGSNEFMACAGFPSGETTLSVYMTRNYGLGTFGTRIRPGQPTGFSVTCLRQRCQPSAPVTDYLASVRHVYCRYVVSERFNGMMNRDPETPKELNREFIYDHGAGMSIQQDNTALVSYRPAAFPSFGPESRIRTLKLCIVFPQQHSRVDEIWIGDRHYPVFSAVSETLSPVYVKDGRVYFAFYPLVPSQKDAMLASIMLETHDVYGMISLFNMAAFEGVPYEEKTFAKYGNGFICELGDEDEWGSFEAFRKKVFAQAEVKDLVWGTERRTWYRRPGRDFTLAYDVGTATPRYAAIDGKPVPVEQLRTDPPAKLVGL